jgi:DNA-binding PadR family transcriptional regulator
VPSKGKLKGFVRVWLERIAPKKARVPQPKVIAVRVANLVEKDFLLKSDTDKFFRDRLATARRLKDCARPLARVPVRDIFCIYGEINDMPLGDLEQLVMLALLRLEREAFGAAVQREIEERTGRMVTLGAVYTALARLEEKGFVASAVGEPLPQRGGRRRRIYRVLPAGRAATAQAWQAMRAMGRGLGPQLEG